MQNIWLYAVCLASGYLLGSVPFGVMVARAKGINIRKVGSGNIGAANVGRALGKRWGTFVLFLDLAKGCLPTAAAFWMAKSGLLAGDGAWLGASIGLGTILGHNFTIFLHFHGGKGVATSAGVFLALAPWAFLAALAVYILARTFLGYYSLASILAAVVLPGAVLLLPRLYHGPPAPPVIVGFAILGGGMVLLRHHANIRRLLRGTEPKSRDAKPAPAAAEGDAQAGK